MTQQQSDINERQPNGERPADARAAVKKYDRRSLTSAENGRRAWANHLRSEIQHIAETTEDQRLRFEALKYLYDRAEGKPYVMTNPGESKPLRVTDNRIQLAIGTLIHGDSAMNTKAAIEQSSKPQPQLLPEP